jgi:MFS family permease
MTRVVSPARALGLVSVVAVLANSTWFSATAVVPALDRQWDLHASGAAWLVAAVQVGFIAGSVGAALFNLPDRVQTRRLIAGAAVGAAVSNAALLLAGGLATALPSRLLVGVCLAGVYAPCVRLVASYFERGRGVATGAVVGALTLGSAVPHLVRGAADLDWHVTILVTSGLALVAAVAIAGVPSGPGAPPAPPLRIGAAVRALRERPLRLATLGYMGHMWELYAVWAWLSAFYVASRSSVGGTVPSRLQTGVVVFAAIGLAGLAGSLAAGRLADRFGRTTITSVAMLVSAACCLTSPLAFGASNAVVIAVLLVWGAAVIADSAQFSAAVTELADPRYAGSALTLQLALGFTLTVATIRLVPLVVGAVGWRFALLPLAVGPLAGAVAMQALRASPAARMLAHGRR